MPQIANQDYIMIECKYESATVNLTDEQKRYIRRAYIRGYGADICLKMKITDGSKSDIMYAPVLGIRDNFGQQVGFMYCNPSGSVVSVFCGKPEPSDYIDDIPNE